MGFFMSLINETSLCAGRRVARPTVLLAVFFGLAGSGTHLSLTNMVTGTNNWITWPGRWIWTLIGFGLATTTSFHVIPFAASGPRGPSGPTGGSAIWPAGIGSRIGDCDDWLAFGIAAARGDAAARGAAGLALLDRWCQAAGFLPDASGGFAAGSCGFAAFGGFSISGRSPEIDGGAAGGLLSAEASWQKAT